MAQKKTNQHKELIDHLIAKNISLAFRDNNICMGDACVYTSYLTKELLKEKFDLDAQLVAGKVDFSPAGVGMAYNWDPPREFHMWVKLGLKVIDIAVMTVPQRNDFNLKYLNSPWIENDMFPLVWGKDTPFEYTKVKNGVEQIESPVDAEDYKVLYEYASKLIDEGLDEVR
ncbi:hypothetical protein [Shouchella shacheensis]|uniref:hypothetical protein n=1 Tax=Shouchella shacheensis TaxID=1649580 RepID=UPI0007405416|nr:hypothetical protein [Shouchella shacheensis]